MQPFRLAVGVALVLPDRHARLDLVDDPAAGVEGRIAVRGAGADPDRELADGQLADAVHAAGLDRAEARHRLLDDARTLGLGQRHVGLVAQALHRPALVVVAHPALERGEGAGAVVQQALAQRGDIEGRVGDAEAGHALCPALRAATAKAKTRATHPAACRKTLRALAGMARAWLAATQRTSASRDRRDERHFRAI